MTHTTEYRSTASWVSCADCLPPRGQTVLTKIDDDKGCRNEQRLKLIGNLWYLQDESMYVYYSPTHWRSL